MKSLSEITKEKPYVGTILFVSTIIIVFVLGLLASSIIERKAEAIYLSKPKAEVGQFDPRNDVWGKNYP